MLRFMISPVIGLGTLPNPYRAAVQDVQNVNTSAVIPTFTSGETIGQPKFRFALCLCATPSIPAIQSVSNALVFPDYNLDARMDGMEAQTRADFVQSVQAYDLNGQGLHFVATHQDSDSYRQVITALGKQLEPTFEVNQLIVAEVAQ